MKVSYLDFWPGFDPGSNWFNLLLKDCFPGVEFDFYSSPENADIILCSSFGNQRYNYKNTKGVKIFYTGENERAQLDVCDYSLSFDYDTHGGRNFRLAHWFLYINWWNEPDFKHSRISVEELFAEPNPNEVWNREKFCSIIIGNPVKNRLEVIEKLNEYKPVEGFGKVFGSYHEGCKIQLIKNYRFNVCFENSITDGYVTEKLLEAKVAGCIPIYYGDVSVANDFNEKCFVNYNRFSSPSELLEEIISIDTNKDKFFEFASRPLFKERPSLEPLKEFIRKAVG